MNRNELNSHLAAILTTLDAINAPAPETSFYLALNFDINKWTMLRGILLQGELVTIDSHLVSLTPKGKTIADKCNGVINGK